MRFVLDAHIPRRLCETLVLEGHECLHVETLELGNRSSDRAIALRADELGAAVVTKDDDFRISHRLVGHPARLVLVTVGNCSNSDLVALFAAVLPKVAEALGVPGMVELRREALILTPREDTP